MNWEASGLRREIGNYAHEDYAATDIFRLIFNHRAACGAFLLTRYLALQWRGVVDLKGSTNLNPRLPEGDLQHVLLRLVPIVGGPNFFLEAHGRCRVRQTRTLFYDGKTHCCNLRHDTALE